MRIGWDVTQAAKSRGRGIARYVRSLVPELLKLGSELEPEFYLRGKGWWNRECVADLGTSIPRRLLLPPFLGPQADLNLFHSFGNHLPAQSKVPCTFTVHDLRLFDFSKIDQPHKTRLGRNLERTSGLICISQHAASRVRHFFPSFAKEKIQVIPHGVDHQRFCPQDPERIADVRSRLGLSEPYFLQLGSWFPHKNLELSLDAFAATRARNEGARLVFVGGGAPAEYMRELRQKDQNNVLWLEHLSDDELVPVLAGARAFLHPSRYEGFGLPVLESMAVGTPGVISNSTCLPEVAADVWKATSVDAAETFALEMDHLFFDESYREGVKARGLVHASEFTWARTAEQTLNFFKNFSR